VVCLRREKANILHFIVEIKGDRREDAKERKSTPAPCGSGKKYNRRCHVKLSS